MIDRWSGWAFAGSVVAAIVAATLVSSPYYAGLLAYAGVLVVFAISVNFVFGFLGYVTFGQAAFLGLGAYTAGLLATKLGWNYWMTLPLALLPAAGLGALVGFASLRLGGAYFAIASLTVAEILRLVAANWIDLTRGPLGVVVTAPPFPGATWLGMRPMAAYLAVTLILACGCLFLVLRLKQTPYGRAWLAIRQSLPLAEAIGVPTLRYRVATVALSGALAALAGFLLVPKIFVLTPDLFSPTYSAIGLLAVILGGRGTVFGPVIGGLAFAMIPELLRVVDDIRMVVFAGLLLIIVRVWPGGFVSAVARLLRSEAAVAKPAAVSASTTAPVLPACRRRARRTRYIAGCSGSHPGIPWCSGGQRGELRSAHRRNSRADRTKWSRQDNLPQFAVRDPVARQRDGPLSWHRLCEICRACARASGDGAHVPTHDLVRRDVGA